MPHFVGIWKYRIPNKFFCLGCHLLGAAMQTPSLKALASYTMNICQQPLSPVLVVVAGYELSPPQLPPRMSCCEYEIVPGHPAQLCLFLSGVWEVKILTLDAVVSTVWHCGNSHGTPWILSQNWDGSELEVRLDQCPDLTSLSPEVLWAPVMVCWTTQNCMHQFWMYGQNNITKWFQRHKLAYLVIHLSILGYNGF